MAVVSPRNFELTDLPEQFRKQAEAQLTDKHNRSIIIPDSESALDIPTAIAAPQPSPMNGLETRYSQKLDRCVRLGIVSVWRFEPFKLRLGEKLFYTPDFLVVRPNGVLELHETKGYWQEDARVKIKAAATLHPWFRFVAVQEKDGEFVFERFNPR